MILYRDPHYGGPFVRLQSGFYSGERDLQGTTRDSSYTENLLGKISSVRVETGYVAVLYGSLSPTASGGSRVLVGPTSIPDLAAVGLNDRVSSVEVVQYDPGHPALPREGGLALYSAPYLSGLRLYLGRGDYNRARLDSDEVRLWGQGPESACVGPGVIAILYEGDNFESGMNSLMIAGRNSCIQNMIETHLPRVNSIRVLYGAVGRGGASPPDGVVRGITPTQRALRTIGQSPLALVGLPAETTLARNRPVLPLPVGAAPPQGVTWAALEPPAPSASASPAFAQPAPAPRPAPPSALPAEPAKPAPKRTMWVWLWLVLLVTIVALSYICWELGRASAAPAGYPVLPNPPHPRAVGENM